jgi:hypothetical protein
MSWRLRRTRGSPNRHGESRAAWPSGKELLFGWKETGWTMKMGLRCLGQRRSGGRGSRDRPRRLRTGPERAQPALCPSLPTDRLLRRPSPLVLGERGKGLEDSARTRIPNQSAHPPACPRTRPVNRHRYYPAKDCITANHRPLPIRPLSDHYPRSFNLALQIRPSYLPSARRRRRADNDRPPQSFRRALSMALLPSLLRAQSCRAPAHR